MDWTKSMEQSFEFYKVNPDTWKDSELITTVTECKIKRDLDADTLGSVSFSSSENLEECYVRAYLIATQDGVTEKIPLATFLAQSPKIDYDGKLQSISIDGYTPVIELKEKMMPIGYSLVAGANVLGNAYSLALNNSRCPVVKVQGSTGTLTGSFIAEDDDTALSYISDLIATVGYHLDLDANGNIMFAPDQDASNMAPIWSYTVDEDSILYSDMETERDLYGIPNVVQVVYSSDDLVRYATVKNEDSNSPTSIKSRGREIWYRDTKPDLDDPTDAEIQTYAAKLLAEKNTLEYTITYKHGYCPVRIGDCVEINYPAAGLNHVFAKVISQSISCSTGMEVEETATFTKSLWEG